MLVWGLESGKQCSLDHPTNVLPSCQSKLPPTEVGMIINRGIGFPETIQAELEELGKRHVALSQ